MNKMDSPLADASRQPPEGHGSRTQAAATRLRQMIVAGELKPGQRIAEREIGERLHGVSRTPLREALKVLAVEGLITLSPNRGATVTALSLAEVENVLEVIIGLEGLAAERACERISEAQLAQLAELQKEMHAAFDDDRLMDYFETNQAIHQLIVDAAGNPELSRLHAQESARIRRYRYVGNRRHARWAEALREHDDIARALFEREGKLLRELIAAHHRKGWSVAKGVLDLELQR